MGSERALKIRDGVSRKLRGDPLAKPPVGARPGSPALPGEPVPERVQGAPAGEHRRPRVLQKQAPLPPQPLPDCLAPIVDLAARPSKTEEIVDISEVARNVELRRGVPPGRRKTSGRASDRVQVDLRFAMSPKPVFLDYEWVIPHNSWVSTIVEGDFEWDTAKAESNLAKHGVSFAEAATVFADPLAVYLDDGSGVGRMIVIGTSLRERVVFVTHVERGRRDRIISARRATRAERQIYETGAKP